MVELDLAAKRAWYRGYTINFRNIERGLVQKSQYNDLEGTITELSSTGDGGEYSEHSAPVAVYCHGQTNSDKHPK